MALAMPIIAGMISQNVLNLVDTAMVAHLGDAALAAAGLGGFANFMATAFITGLAVGVQAMASRRMGEGREEETAVPLNGGLLLAVGLALPTTVLLIPLVPHVFGWLSDDPAVVALGVPYLQVRLVAVLAVGCNFAFRGYWNGVNLSRLYMGTLITMHVCNVILNYLLIFGAFGFPELGVVGAAWGTAASTYVGLLTYVVLGLRVAQERGFLRGLPTRQELVSMLKLSVPAGLQNFFFAAGMTVFFAIVAEVSTAALAASQVLVNVLLVALLPGIGFGLAAASLVGQALGRGEAADARRWGLDVARTAMVSVGLVALPVVAVPDMVLAPFLHDPDTLALARWPLRLIMATIWWDVAGLVLMNALLGAGDSRRVMLVALAMQWALGLPLAWLLGVHLELGLAAIWGVQVGYRGLQGLIFVFFWRGERWAKIEV